MAALPVTAPTDADVQLQLLNLLVRRIEQGHSPKLVEAGLSPQLLDDLRELKHADMARLVEQPLGLSIMVEAPMLHHQIRVLNAQMSERRTLEYFVAAQAPVALLRQCFRLTKSEITSLRRAMHVADDAAYSPVRAADKRAIEAHWLNNTPAAHAEPAELIAFWMDLHRRFEHLTLASIYGAVQSFERLAREQSAAEHTRVQGDM